MAKKMAKKAAKKPAPKKKAAAKAPAAKAKPKAAKAKPAAKPQPAKKPDREEMLREQAAAIASKAFHAGKSVGAAAKAISDEGIKLAEKLPGFVENVYAMSKKRVGQGMTWVAEHSPMAKPKKSAKKK